MKIAHCLPWYFPESLGGTEIYVHALAVRLRAAGNTVLIAAPDSGAPGERQYEHDGFPVFRYGIPSAPTRDEVQGRQPVRGAEQIRSWFADQRFDIVHFHTFSTGLGVAEMEAAKATGARVVATTHSSSLGYLCQRGTMMRWGSQLCDGIAERRKCAACALQARGLPRPLAGIAAAIPLHAKLAAVLPGPAGTLAGMSDLIAHNLVLQRKMFDLVDQFVVLTRWAKDVLLANGAPESKVSVNPLGYSQRVARKPGPAEKPTVKPVKVGYLGRFEDVKGVVDLARAASRLRPDCPVRIEFRGPVRSESDRAILGHVQQLLGSDPRFTTAPAVASEEAPRLLADYDVLCCPAICAEGGPTVAIESHAVGTPVIGTRIGGLAELINDDINGRLVAPGDWRALSALLEEIANDPAGTVDRWRTALPAARTMDDVAADTIALYKRWTCYADASLAR